MSFKGKTVTHHLQEGTYVLKFPNGEWNDMHWKMAHWSKCLHASLSNRKFTRSQSRKNPTFTTNIHGIVKKKNQNLKKTSPVASHDSAQVNPSAIIDYDDEKHDEEMEVEENKKIKKKHNLAKSSRYKKKVCNKCRKYHKGRFCNYVDLTSDPQKVIAGHSYLLRRKPEKTKFILQEWNKESDKKENFIPKKEESDDVVFIKEGVWKCSNNPKSEYDDLHKPCPTCNRSIFKPKHGGCAVMLCTGCFKYFCFHCGQNYGKADPKFHLRCRKKKNLYYNLNGIYIFDGLASSQRYYQ